MRMCIVGGFWVFFRKTHEGRDAHELAQAESQPKGRNGRRGRQQRWEDGDRGGGNKFGHI